MRWEAAGNRADTRLNLLFSFCFPWSFFSFLLSNECIESEARERNLYNTFYDEIGGEYAEAGRPKTKKTFEAPPCFELQYPAVRDDDQCSAPLMPLPPLFAHALFSPPPPGGLRSCPS